jgi:hypothetical protein
VKVSPSVVTVDGAVKPVGIVTVLEPMMRKPELDITVWPSGRVVVTSPGCELVADGGMSVNVSPSVVKIDSEETVGSVTVSLPIMRSPELEITVWPSGSIVVTCETLLGVVFEVKLGGKKVKVSPSVTSVLGVVTVGICIVSLPPIIMNPELETTVCPSGSIVVDGEMLLIEVELGGKNVKVSPSVMSVVGVVTLGIGIVSLPPIMRNPELETTIWPSGSVKVDCPPIPLPGDEDEEGGRKVNVSESVTSVVGAVTVGIGIVSLPPMTKKEELDTTT